MFVFFLMAPALSSTAYAFAEMTRWNVYESLAVLPISLGLFGYLGWVFMDSSWLNFDDEEKDNYWKTSRWLKFLPLFLLPLVKFLAEYFSNVDKDPLKTGVRMAALLQDFLVILLGYFSLCVSHGSGLGRLFQPFTVPRSRVYTDDKGQRFEVNFIGTTLSILLVIFFSWKSMPIHLARIYHYIFFKNIPLPIASRVKCLSDTAEGRLIADIVVLLFMFYSFGVMFISCVQVTFFVNNGTLNYLKFTPIPLTPIAILFSDQFCTYGVVEYTISKWVIALCHIIVNFVAYVSLVSPPDSLTAILFQPHVPMISTVTDLPDMKDVADKPRTTAVFPENRNDKEIEIENK